jgi:hypothetical protein
MKSSGGRVPRTKTSHLNSLLQPKAKTRKRQAAQVYSKLFFESRIESRLTALMEKSKPAEIETPKEYQRRLMSTRGKLTYEMWKEDQHIPEVAEAVAKEKERLDCELEECEQSDKDEGEGEDDCCVGQSLKNQDVDPSEQQK